VDRIIRSGTCPFCGQNTGLLIIMYDDQTGQPIAACDDCRYSSMPLHTMGMMIAHSRQENPAQPGECDTRL